MSFSTPAALASRSHAVSGFDEEKTHSVVPNSSENDRISAETNRSMWGLPRNNTFFREEPVAGRESLNSYSSVNRRKALKFHNTRQLAFRQVSFRRLVASRCCRCSRKIVENIYFTLFTATLTVYALIGDDFRLLATNQPADQVFNIITLVCLFVFTIEILLSCAGKRDYFLGFFFVLDVIATCSLILDLTWVSEMMMGNSEENLDQLRSGRTARIGARAGRVVRVMRLVRILKLYKAVQDARAAKQKARQESDDDDWDRDDEAEEKEEDLQESRVGKKLSEMTTRRVIILVLTMLLVLPFLRVDASLQSPTSPFMGADLVWEAYKDYLLNTTSEADRLRYEQAMLRQIYYHNWFTEECPSDSFDCPAQYLSHLFWSGIVSSSRDGLEIGTDSEIELRSEVELRPSTVADWNANTAGESNVFYYGTMPSEALTILGSAWLTDCEEADKNIYRKGVSILATSSDRISYAVPCPEDLRPTERIKFYPRLLTSEEYEQWHFAFYFDLRPFTREEASFSLAITGFICIVLCVASLYFSNDANRLVLYPVENMIKRVEMIRDNPLVAMSMADEEFKVEEKMKERLAKKEARDYLTTMKNCVLCRNSTPPEEPMETVILEKTIIKLGSLLALGFGEAGANIIGQNMNTADSAVVNAMIPGTRVDCIIGIARIRNFSAATEVLKGKVMTFVNQIAEIVHGIVDEYHGAANKNNGETFLLIWRLNGFEEKLRQRIADLSMIAFAKILGTIHRSYVLASYRGHPGLQQRLGSNCRVCLTLGLHAGWAIEGAVGTEFKIDASYLSPNVSIAGSIEGATKIYGVPMMVSETVIQGCSPAMGAKCRLIDHVMMKGSTFPLRLYSLDLDYWSLTVDEPNQRFAWNPRQRFKARQFLESEKLRKLDPKVSLVKLFESSRDILTMRKRYTTDFLQQFNMGFQNYLEGEWAVARRLLMDTKMMLHIEDGPSEALLCYMERTHFQAPHNWVGVRDLIID